jgi:transposase InsO family protein
MRRKSHVRSEGGPEKPTGRKPSRVHRSDPYTEQPTAEGKVYVALVLDAWSRRVIGWSIAVHLRTTLVVDALRWPSGGAAPPRERQCTTPIAGCNPGSRSRGNAVVSG